MRLSNFVVQSIPIPPVHGPFTYDGNAHTGVVEFFAYELSGTPVAVNADVYSVTATIPENAPYYWSDWTAENGKTKWGARTVTWSIKQLGVTLPGHEASFVYDATEHTPVDLALFDVDDDGYAHVTKEGNRLAYCQLLDYRKTDQGNYTVTAKLVADYTSSPNVTNFIWQSTGQMADRTYPWKITTAPNSIDGFYYDGYVTNRIKAAHHPKNHFTARWGKDTALYYYCTADGDGTKTGDWQEWGTDGPQEKGNYRVKVVIPEPSPRNWNGDEVELPFGVWEKWSDIYEDRLQITVTGNTSGSTELKNFPVPVKVKEPVEDGFEQFSGFSYMRAGATGKDIHFFTSDGDPVPHEVDIWNTRGESVVWVRVPSLKSTTTKLWMCWKRVNGIRLPEYDPTAVWRDRYAGVWHLTKLEGGRYVDSTGHGLNAFLTGGAAVETIETSLGKAIHLKNGELRAANYEPYLDRIGGPFMFTGLWRGDDYHTNGTKGQPAQNVCIFAGNKAGGQSQNPEQFASGWALTINNNVANYMPYVSGNNNLGNKTINDIRSNWNFMGLRVPEEGTSQKVTTFYNADSTDNDSKTVITNTLPLQLIAQGFSAEEIRLAKTLGDLATDKAWAKAERASLTSSSFCTYGLVIREELTCDWWSTRPTISKKTWKQGETAATVNSGAYKSGAAVTKTFLKLPEKTPLSPNAMPTTVGYYRVVIDHSAPATYWPRDYQMDFYIIEKVDPTTDIGGNGGDSGRVLLMNADNNANCAVTNQGWCARDPHGVTCWRRLAGDDYDGTNNVLGGTSFELVRGSDGQCLWYLENCRMGNTFPTNLVASSATTGLLSTHVYLPPSASSAMTVTNETVMATKRGDAGWAMLRNVENAAAYSPCYTNGIGTIYFDAVNGLKTSGEGYHLVLEIARQTTDGRAPTDANSWSVDPDDESITNRFGKLEGRWERLEMAPSQFPASTTPTDLPKTDELALKVATGGAMTRFYRVHAVVNEHEPVRFRIRRVTVDPTLLDVDENRLEDDGFILLDNVIASIPPVFATLEPYGSFDAKLTGDVAVGVGGAFDPPFPSAASAGTFKGRCRVKLPAGSGYEEKDPSEYLSLAQMFYRWRHLGQFEDFTVGNAGEWKIAALGAAAEGGGLETAEPLEIPGGPGDVEFNFVTIMKTPFYKYVDYTGSRPKVCAADFTEEIAMKESRLQLSDYGVTRLASAGSDWFTRLREGASDWEGVTLELRGAISNDCPMRLVGDGTWRALVKIPRDAPAGEVCEFRFRGRNLQSPGTTFYARNETVWGGGASEVELPRNGLLTAGGAATSFKVDHVANYLEFRMKTDGASSWSVCRGEYQNFNAWHDVWTSAGSQKFVSGTNGVDDVSMKTSALDMDDWQLYGNENSAWSELFKLVNYNDPGFPKETLFQNHATPSVWNAQNLLFVSKTLPGDWKAPSTADTASGMAAKLKGQGAGLLEFTKTNRPKGLESVSFTARIGQSLGFDDINYAVDCSKKKNYVFLTAASMSRSIPVTGTTADKDTGDMSVGAAVSLYAYYRESKGCYEFRATRVDQGARLLLELFKWHPVDGAMVQTRLCGQYYKETGNDALRLWDNSTDELAKYYGLFISVETAGSSTKIYGGIGRDAADAGSSFSGDTDAANGYGGLFYEDRAADRLTSGAYGLAAKDCPARFMRPRHFDHPVSGTITPAANCSTYPAATAADGKYFKPTANKKLDIGGLSTPTDDYADPGENWELPGQIESWGQGFRTPVGTTQTVKLLLQQAGSTEWKEVASRTVSGYSLEDFEVPLYLTGDWNLRLTTGSKAVDVVIGEVRQRQWQAGDHENITYGTEDFVYTQGCIASNLVFATREAVLQPARGLPTKAVSVRSPIVRGCGKISFSYANADPNAELWVQVATNNVEYSLTGSGGYNFSVKSVEKGEQAAVGEWITLAKYGASSDCDDVLGGSGEKTVYLGWHDAENAPLTGVFRVFVPPHVVEQAVLLATNATHQIDYGRVAVTAMTVTDEPALSDNSWRGWNLRTAGDGTDAEGRMYLSDALIPGDPGHGLSCALNNSVNDVLDGKEAEAAHLCPAIWSPTMKTTDGQRRSIGAVSFRARLYYPGDARETSQGGKVTVWGASQTLSENWTKLGEFAVTSSTYSNYTWTAGNARYLAIKLEVSGAAAKTRSPDTDRVVLDEIVLSEKVEEKIGFAYVRPFRMNLFEETPVDDILSMNEQPLVGETWGVQTKLQMDQLEQKPDHVEVYLTYYVGESPWGYGNWKSRGSTPVKLTQVGDPGDWIFRSVGTLPAALVEAVSSAATVQYMVFVKYAGSEGGAETDNVQAVEDWAQPEWYWPKDLNKERGAESDPDKFSLYNILDAVSPGRAWINEVNWNDGTPQSKTNQFLEICVPAGADMSDWAVRVTDINRNQRTLAVFGLNVPAVKKASPKGVANFEFVVLESPLTTEAGGIRNDAGEHVEADGTWTAVNMQGGSVTSGTLDFSYPFQFELLRPSGIVEHQFVLGGTNTLKGTYLDYLAYIYDPTNLLASLNADAPSPKRFLAGEDVSRQAGGVKLASVGVTGGTENANPPPGGDGTWTSPMKFTPGELNEGQVIPAGWYLPPTGTNAWVTLTVVGDHLTQTVGGESAPVLKLVVPKDTPTNVVYQVPPWYEVASLTVDGNEVASHQARGGHSWTYVLTPTGQVCEVVATEGADVGLDAFKLPPDYRDAVTSWLSTRYPDATPDNIQLAAYKGTENSTPSALSLTEMYWLDIPPVPANDAERDFATAGGTNWWLRGKIVGWRPNAYVRTRHYAEEEVDFINTQVDVQLYVSNAVTTIAQAPQYLQGRDGQRSDSYTGMWRSETFQIVGWLNNGQPLNQGYLPFRSFVFDAGSFTPATDPKPFTTTVEINDPFSTESPGYSYGWNAWPRSTGFDFKWTISTNAPPYTIQTLRAKDVYGP